MDILKKLELTGIIPVIKIDNANDALPLMGALLGGGLSVSEITFRTSCAKQAISLISSKCTDMLVGASTILSPTQVDDAMDAGAKFIVTAGFNTTVIDYCLEKKITVIPGCQTTSNIEMALERGIRHVKFFPAEQLGGVAMIDALSKPYPMMKFMPTGGIRQNNLNDYLAHPKIFCCGGSYMVSEDLIKSEKYDEITLLTRNCINSMLDLSIHHVAVNSNTSESNRLQSDFCRLLNVPHDPTGAFAGGIIEIISKPVRGDRGHIAFSTKNLERAIHYLAQRGFQLDKSSISKDANGKITVAYLQENLGGFALHLMKK